MQRLREAERALPIDGEEDTALREELQSREQEVISLRDEVARLKEQSTSDARVTMTRLPTPPSCVLVCCLINTCSKRQPTAP